MSVLNDSQIIVSEMLSKHNVYSKTLKSFLLTNIRSDKEVDSIFATYETFFKHYYLYEYCTKEFLTKVTPVLVGYVGISLVALKFFGINKKEVLDFLETGLKNNKEELSDEFKKYIDAYVAEKDYQFKDLVIGSIEHLSILYNLPIWFIQMILNQYGKKVAKPIFDSFLGEYKDTYFLNSLKDLDKLEKAKVDEFKENKDGTYDLVNKSGESELINDSTFIRNQPVFNLPFNDLHKFNNKYVTLYEDERSFFYFRFLNEYMHRSNVINLAFKSLDDNHEAINGVKLLDLNNVFVYESTVGEMIAHLANKQDLIFYLPLSTNMQKFYYCPEYRVNFKQNDIDSIILKEKDDLQEISSHLENNGTLVYSLNTIDKKETSNLIKEFLENNKDFVLEKEDMVIPTKKNQTFGYYAILKRKNHA